MTDLTSAAPAVTESQEINLESDEALQEEDSTLSNEGQAELAKAEAPKPEAAKSKKTNKLKLKYNGKESEEILPFEFDDDPKTVEYLQKQLQLAKMGQTKSQDYATLQKQVDQFFDELIKDPKKILKNPNLGFDIKKIAAEILEEEIENSKKSPEQIEKEQLQARLKELESEREKEKNETRAQQLKMLEEQEFQRYDNLISDAIDSTDLPKSAYVVKKIADYMIMGVEKGLDITPKDVMPIVREEIINDFKEMVASMPYEAIQNLFGKEVLDKARKQRVAAAKTGQGITKPKVVDVGTPNSTSKDQPKTTYKDFFGF